MEDTKRAEGQDSGPLGFRNMAERVGFEPTVRFPVHSISSAASSTTPAPLHTLSETFPGPALIHSDVEVHRLRKTLYVSRRLERESIAHTGDSCHASRLNSSVVTEIGILRL